LKTIFGRAQRVEARQGGWGKRRRPRAASPWRGQKALRRLSRPTTFKVIERKGMTMRASFIALFFAALALAGCNATREPYGYDRNGNGPFGYTENYWKCGQGGACGSDYGFGHGAYSAGPPVD
jgi:hypothetical protein